jgi:hypothetical protein
MARLPPHAELGFPQVTSTRTACKLASSAAGAYLAINTNASHAVIPAELGHNCIKSVPNRKQPVKLNPNILGISILRGMPSTSGDKHNELSVKDRDGLLEFHTVMVENVTNFADFQS